MKKTKEPQRKRERETGGGGGGGGEREEKKSEVIGLHANELKKKIKKRKKVKDL